MLARAAHPGRSDNVQWRVSVDSNLQDLIDDGSISFSYELDHRLVEIGPENRYDVPLCLLREGWSTLQATVRALHELHGLRFSEIARLLDRDARTIWASYHQRANDPLPRIDAREQAFPADLLADRRLSAFEAVTAHLLELRLPIARIAQLLGRNAQTIYAARRSLRAKGVLA